MPIRIAKEALLSFSEAAKLLPGRPDRSTLHRWATKGIRGIQLETAVVGRSRLTSVEALQRFVDRVTQATDGAPKLGRNQAHDLSRATKAAEYLSRTGI